MWKYIAVGGIALLLMGCNSSSSDPDMGMEPPPGQQNDIVDLAQQILGDDPFGQPRDLNGLTLSDGGKRAELP